jgi:DNA primase
VIWPYYEFESLVYWQSRSYLNKTFRFPSPDVRDKTGNVIGKITASKGQFLYGFDDVQMNSYIIITEAIFDKHTLGEQALASGGAVLTSDQLIKIRLLNPKSGIILAPDSDSAGIKSVIQNYSLLKSMDYAVYYSLPPSIDGNDKTDWNEMFEKFKISKTDIRSALDKNIKPINAMEVVKLHKIIGTKNSIVR